MSQYAVTREPGLVCDHADIPSILDEIAIIFGIGAVLLFIVEAILLGWDDWMIRAQFVGCCVLVPAYLRSIRRVIAWRDFLDRHGLGDARWSR